jgi:hypothetical protein
VWKELKAGDEATVNDSGDIKIDREVWPWIGKTVRVVEITKGGLYVVECDLGTRRFRKRNLDPLSRAGN